ncbi:MAG: DNA-3-methyladenine glycosylase I, partial [Alphaproteobacteria bacterium]
MVGKDTFVLSNSVVVGLKRWEEMAPPKNRKDRAAAQLCFNAWAAETGRPLSQLSMILALSVDE